MAFSDPAYINDVLQAILDHVCDCLSNTPLGSPSRCYLSFTRPPDDCCDYLAIWFSNIYPTRTFPEIYEGVDNCGDVGRFMEVKLKLRRGCWPVLKDNPVSPFPPSEEIQAAAEDLTIDANVLWCCLANGFTTGAAWLDGDSGCLDTRLDSLVPDQPEGGCSGMTATILVELEGCCSDEFAGSV